MSDAPSPSAAHKLPYWELVIMIASMMALNAAAIDIFIPSLQQIGNALNVATGNERQFVITAPKSASGDIAPAAVRYVNASLSTQAVEPAPKK